MVRALLISLLALAALPATGQARPWSHVERAPLPDPMPTVVHGKCPGAGADLAGCYFGMGESDVYGRVFEDGAIYISSRYSKFHELGHAFDDTMMDADEREAFTRIRDTTDLLWTWSDGDGSGALYQAAGSPAEDFADAWASCRLQRTPWGLWEAGYGYYPTPREHWRVCRLIARAGRDHGATVAVDGSR